MALSFSHRRSLAAVTISLFVLPVLVSTSVLVFSCGPARAEDKTAARDHWERGTKFYDLGKYDDAIREFEAAYEAKGDPAFLYNLAQSHRLAGHVGDSLRFYKTYLRYVPKAPNRADIEERIKELEKIVAERPSTDSAGTTTPPPSVSATSGGQTVPSPGIAPSTQFPPPTGSGVVPGQTGTGAQPPPGQGSVPGAGGPFDHQQPMGAVPGTQYPVAPLSEPAPVPQASGRKTAGITIAAIGGGVVVVGAVFGLIARSQSKKVENADRFDPAAESWGKTSETLQWVGYGVGAAAAITGVILYATAPRPLEAVAPPQVAIAPLVGSNSGGALLRVSF